jgi:hypothetical protein
MPERNTASSAVRAIVQIEFDQPLPFRAGVRDLDLHG